MRGFTVPGTLATSVAIGALLMLTRVLLGTEGAMADSDRVVGALAITFAVIAMAEVARAVRLLNVVLGGWLVIAPWVLEGASPLASGASVVLGLSLAALRLPRGTRSDEHYAGWDRFIL